MFNCAERQEYNGLDRSRFFRYNDDMKVFAVSDLHLSGKSPKPMDIFGGNWTGHLDKIKTDWKKKVSPEDVVLIAGDISWAMYLEDGLFDLNRLSDLPGKKVFIRGNHDYWWHGITKLRESRPDDSFFFLQNDCVKFGNLVIAGSRGWTCPGSSDYTARDEKIYKREAERFKLAFAQAQKLREEGDKLFVMIHYPPMNARLDETLFTRLFAEQKANKVIFGHIHGSIYFPLYSRIGDIEYYLTSCDKRMFNLTEIPL